MIKKLTGIQAIVGLTLVLLGGCRISTNETIRISGSTTIAGFIQKTADSYSSKTKGVHVNVRATGSMNGISAVIEGKQDIAMSSSEISQEDIARAKKNGVSLKAFLLGYDVIVPIVNPSNTVEDISITALKEIYNGTITQWNEIGGADTGIDVVDRGLSSGTHAVWHHALDDIAGGTSMKITESRSNSSVLAYVAQHTNSIGYISAAYLNPEVKALMLDGVTVKGNDSLLSRYNLKRPLLLYVKEAQVTSAMKGFIAYLLFNGQSTKLLREAGFYPVYPATDFSKL